MADDKVFAEGLYFEKPREGAPEFVLGGLSIQPSKLVEFLSSQSANKAGYLNFDILVSKKTGKPYIVKNDYEKKEPVVNAETGQYQAPEGGYASQQAVPEIQYPDGEIDPNDIPF